MFPLINWKDYQIFSFHSSSGDDFTLPESTPLSGGAFSDVSNEDPDDVFFLESMEQPAPFDLNQQDICNGFLVRSFFARLLAVQ